MSEDYGSFVSIPSFEVSNIRPTTWAILASCMLIRVSIASFCLVCWHISLTLHKFCKKILSWPCKISRSHRYFLRSILRPIRRIRQCWICQHAEENESKSSVTICHLWLDLSPKKESRGFCLASQCSQFRFLPDDTSELIDHMDVQEKSGHSHSSCKCQGCRRYFLETACQAMTGFQY